MTASSEGPAATRVDHRVLGLDSLRFVCATWVVLHHGARPEIAEWLGLSNVAQDWNAVAFNGVAAVIVFFVISGLCVHYPYARSAPCRLPAYFAQRYVRVGIPLLVVMAFMKFSGRFVGDDVANGPTMVLWSLWCELIYYTIYPALLIAFRRFGFLPVLAAAFIAAYAVIFTHLDFIYYATYSRTLAWVTALPAWLLGCVIAQMIAAGQLPALPGSIWWWRVAAVLLSIPPKALVYQSISPVVIGNPATLTMFSLFVFLWLIKEVSVFRSNPPPALLEWGGRWSYSLYLVHHVVIVAFSHVSKAIPGFVLWPLRLTAVFAASYGFYVVVERPAHLLARAIARQLRKPGVTTDVAKLRVAAITVNR